MPKSLKVMIKKLAHKGKITDAECQELITKLDGHDAELHKEGYEQGYADGFAECLEVNT